MADAPLSGSGLNPSALAGTSFTAPLANFTDADPGDSPSSYNVSVNLGDNSSVCARRITVPCRRQEDHVQ